MRAQDLDVLRDVRPPANNRSSSKKPSRPAAKKDLMSSDPQLAATVLLLKLQLAGAQT